MMFNVTQVQEGGREIVTEWRHVAPASSHSSDVYQADGRPVGDGRHHPETDSQNLLRTHPGETLILANNFLIVMFVWQ